ncbi:MAG: hypothetical protein JWM40_1978 [Frankiales bacterium]|nr:hypothetical protein [Frankiales bacterium]
MTTETVTAQARSLRPLGRAALIGAPALIVVARLVSVPWDDSHPADYVRHVAGAPVRSDIGATLIVLAAAVSIAAIVYLTELARAERPRLGLLGGILAGAGYVGMVGMGTKSLDAGQIIRHSPRATAISVSQHLALDVHTIDLLIISGTIGYILIAVCLYRDQLTPHALAILIGFGGVTTMFTSGGPIRPLIVGAALLLTAGQTWLAGTSRSTANERAGGRLDQPSR